MRQFHIEEEQTGLLTPPFSVIDWEQSRNPVDPKVQELETVNQLGPPEQVLLEGELNDAPS